MSPESPSLTVPRAACGARRAGPAGLLLAVALLSAGCANEPPVVAPPPPPVEAPAPAAPPPKEEPDEPPPPVTEAPAKDNGSPRASIPRQMLQYADKARSMGTAELAAEITQLSNTQQPSPEKTLQLAIVLMHTRQAPDTARALGLVQRVMADNTAPAPTLHPLARLLEGRLLQQRRLEDQLDRQNQQLRDAQRRIDQLNDRLEAMRAIERSLNARPGGVNDPAKGAQPPPAAEPQR
ncbi:hypothetical protein [Paracidovorax valerianellae]|uniref:Uncharacterized protein n=1 Tax=Paracidovorax valerianellae TaxID=187868 RepID=A0A1G6PZ44_9BURK|nr:hypothetical protein [Paracidovorax valerianellae]MDA8444518.1 hypothetical protein [Paracidovorax valerianellae]SDC85349.1 hypothetical protein SAMN05192589_103382 [Paracidovorax valerianellae]